MSNAKSRGVDETPKKQDEAVSVERLANLGEVVVTSRGSVTIKEPTLEQVIELLAHLLPLADAFKGTNIVDGKDFFVQLAAKPEVRDAFRKVAASLAGVQEEFFTELGITDWLKIFIAVKKVVNWDELSQLFSQLDLMTLLNQVQ